jgi:phosphatidylglycerol:prolipoprotein diacylglycerol transferase
MIEINWNPIAHLGPIPINWYGITVALGFLVGGYLVWRWAPRYDVPRDKIEQIMIWIVIGSVIGARFYYVIQNDFGSYVSAPWRMLAVWEGGLAYFGGLFGGTLAAFLYTRRARLEFPNVADLFATAIPIGAAIGRISCGLAGMDYGTPTTLPWGFVYTNPNSYAPTDGVPRHPDQYYELVGDLIIASVLWKLRGKLPRGGLFLFYLILFSILRFLVFFVRGSVNPVALGLKNAQWTALAILAVSVPLLIGIRRAHKTSQAFPADKSYRPT